MHAQRSNIIRRGDKNQNAAFKKAADIPYSEVMRALSACQFKPQPAAAPVAGLTSRRHFTRHTKHTQNIIELLR